MRTTTALPTRPAPRGFVRRSLSVAALAASAWIGLTAVPAAAQTAAVVDRGAFLRAIAQVETGGNARAVGRQGERGMYQFSRTTWRLHTSQSFQNAHHPTISYAVAERHFEWLHAGLIRAGRQPTPYLMAAAWNAGLSRAVGGRLPASTRDYATRVTNIVVAQQRSSRPSTLLAAAPVTGPAPVPPAVAEAVSAPQTIVLPKSLAPAGEAGSAGQTTRFVIGLIE